MNQNDPIQIEDPNPNTNPDPNAPLIILTGATGYVGGRLLRQLIDAGFRVRCLVRRDTGLEDESDAIEVAMVDLLEGDGLAAAMEGGSVAYYLVHSMGSSEGFTEQDRRAARNFGTAAREAGLDRIIYLGGLGEDLDDISEHLRSRHEVGDVLRKSLVPVIEFRASIVIGSGSLSFELVRALVERLPVMIAPRWVSVPTQPIAINDLLSYLSAAAILPIEGNRIFEIGGADVTSYGDIMRTYAGERGLHRRILPVPVLTPRLSSWWLGFVTPVYARVGRKLIESVRNPTVVNDRSALEVFSVRPVGIREAVRQAIAREDRDVAATRWSDSLSSSGRQHNWTSERFGNRRIMSRSVHVDASPSSAFAVISRVGGANGWYFANWLWTLRGLIDLLAGGVGVRRGRSHPDRLRVGDAVDWWRVESLERDRRLVLAAEMEVPGRAWLAFELDPKSDGTEIRQTAIFDPIGLRGLAYWYGTFPLHQVIFSRMVRNIGKVIDGTYVPLGRRLLSLPSRIVPLLDSLVNRASDKPTESGNSAIHLALDTTDSTIEAGTNRFNLLRPSPEDAQ
jgi:uncharacterized protein YbjT (DUF2867 family)